MRPFTQRLIDRTHLSVTVALRVSHIASQSSYATSHHTQHTQQGMQADEGCEDLVHARLIPTDIQVCEKSSITYSTSILLYITGVHLNTTLNLLISCPLLSYPIILPYLIFL